MARPNSGARSHTSWPLTPRAYHDRWQDQRGGDGDPLRPLREMQAFVTRSLLSLVHGIQHTGLHHPLEEQVRRITRWVLRVAGQTQEPAPHFGMPRIEVPAWWRVLEEFEGAYANGPNRCPTIGATSP